MLLELHEVARDYLEDEVAARRRRILISIGRLTLDRHGRVRMTRHGHVDRFNEIPAGT